MPAQWSERSRDFRPDKRATRQFFGDMLGVPERFPVLFLAGFALER